MRPNLDDRETGRARSRSRDSKRGEPPEEGSGDETSDRPQDHPPDSPTKRNEMPVRAQKEADQSPADAGASRRQLSQPRGSITSWPPRAQQSATAPTCTPRARQSTTSRASGIGAPMTPLGHFIRGEAGPVGTGGRQADDAPTYSTPTSE